MHTTLFLITSTILFILGIIIPFFTPIYLFSTDNNLWAYISIAASVVSYISSKKIAAPIMLIQHATNSAIVGNAFALIYHTLLLTAVFTYAPRETWWVLILASWEIARHPIQDIINTTRATIIEQPYLYASNPQLRTNANIHGALQIYITGYTSIIASIFYLINTP